LKSFNPFMLWCAIATRYDKLVLTYWVGVVIDAVIVWPCDYGDRP
jgi:hypothetical protein